MSDCSYAAMSNHKLTVANLCVKSNSMCTNFADNGKIHTCMYNVCTMYVRCIPRQLAWFHHGSWRVVCTEMNTIFGATFVGHWFVGVFCSLRSHGTRDKAGSIIDKGYRERVLRARSAHCAHTAHASLMGAYAPKRSANRALSREDGDVCWALK